jgi:hypothetical protein
MEYIEKPLKTSTTHPCMLKYLKNRYETDEEYKQKQIEKGKLRYQMHKEEILRKLKENEDKTKRNETAHNYYLKKKEEGDEEYKRKKAEIYKRYYLKRINDEEYLQQRKEKYQQKKELLEQELLKNGIEKPKRGRPKKIKEEAGEII